MADTFEAGDHELFVARVDSLGSAEPHPMPLLYYRRQYLRIQRARRRRSRACPSTSRGGRPGRNREA